MLLFVIMYLLTVEKRDAIQNKTIVGVYKTIAEINMEEVMSYLKNVTFYTNVCPNPQIFANNFIPYSFQNFIGITFYIYKIDSGIFNTIKDEKEGIIPEYLYKLDMNKLIELIQLENNKATKSAQLRC
jgi:hypothetical protein